MSAVTFRGSIPALVTPFDDDGAFVEGAYRDLIEWQISEGSAGLVPCGTTGEAATLTFAEHFEAVRVCVDQTKGRVPVLAGAGSNDTRVAAANLRAAKEAGADAALMVPPYYNRPSQEGIYQHFAALAADSPLPIVLYNVPGRTVTDIQPATMARIARAFPDVFIGVKDATGQLGRVTEQRLGCGENFAQLSGNDETALAFNAMGGVGCISVTANVAPRLCAEFQAACAARDHAKALALHDRLYPLHIAMFADASPGPVKYALNQVRPAMPKGIRLPMTWPSEATQAAVNAALTGRGAGVSVDPNEIAIWTRAWAISRNCPPPAPAFGGWFIDVGLPDQVSRYVFAKLNPVRLRTLGTAIREPHVLIKHPTNAAAVQAALGPDWDAVRTGWFMRSDLADAPVTEASGFTVAEEPGPARQYRMTCPQGEEAARARLTIIGAHAIIDSVDTEPAFRRRGLASALMSRLAADARAAGAKTGLLTATDAGLMVYERLGWTVLAPWTTAQLKVST